MRLDNDSLLNDWRADALNLERGIGQVMVGQSRAIRLLVVAVFARGHVLLEGDVGVGKTTLLRAAAHALGGEYERIEGTIDLLPSDLVYYTYLSEEGKPCVAAGPLLKHGESLSVFFFNEINRARPQVHSLLLRVMAERGVSAFNREYRFPHLLVFADRNRIEKEETFELPSASRDRFLMEILIEAPAQRDMLAELMFEPRFHDTDALIAGSPRAVVRHDQLNAIAVRIQQSIHVSEAMREYALNLCLATRRPRAFGVELSETDVDQVIQAGASPRGMSLLLRAARTAAWLEGRSALLPEDIHSVFFEAIGHRVFFKPLYEMRRAEMAAELLREILHHVATP